MNGMSNWEKRFWLVFVIFVSAGVARHFGNAALEKLEAIRLIADQSLKKVEVASDIVKDTKDPVLKASTNSDTIVTQSQKVLEEIAALKEWRDRFEQEMRDRADRFEWRIDHPIDAALGRKPKGGQR
ncbi:MAG: hypothetical protein Q7S16_00020 [bacterium]|nr:hypothetical protein [bacterium]